MNFFHPSSKLQKFIFITVCTSLIVASISSPNYAEDKSVCSFINAKPGTTVNVRSGPGTNFKVVTTLKRGDGVRAIERKGTWVKLTGRTFGTPPKETVKPLNGWVSNQFINGCSEDKFDMWRQ